MKERKPEKEDLSLKDLIMREILSMENSMVMANITLLTQERYTKVNLLRTTCTVLE